LLCGRVIFEFFENLKMICTAPILELPPGIFSIILAPKLKEEKRLNFCGGKIRITIIRRKQKLSKTNVCLHCYANAS
jgi:hypothetical protein